MSPEEVFKKLSPSVFVVEDLDKDNGLNPHVVAIGSAVAIAPDEVVTNRHVITAGFAWRIRQGDKTWPAHITWIDPNHDLALLRVPALHAVPVALRESQVTVGERVYAIGAPEGLELTLSEGLVSGVRGFQDGDVIQTTTPISPGSSGGGLFDKYGKLTGITSFGLVEGQNLNFALPVGWIQALPKHNGRENQARLPSKDDKDAFSEADAALIQLNTWESSALLKGTHLPQSVISPGIGNAVSKLEMNCIFNSNESPDCLDNWPTWQQAAMHMVDLGDGIQAAQHVHYPLVQQALPSARSIWSRLKTIYCEDRPGGLFTDLQGNINTCPGPH